MLLRFDGRFDAFEHLFDEIDATARAVKFIAQHLIGRAGRSAEAAMHARAQDCVGLNAFGRVFDEVG